MLKQILQNQGLTSKEIAIYTCLLELGEQPASIVARRVNLPRSGCYNVLSRLCSRGLLIQIVKNRLTHYAASSPSMLLEQISQNHSREIRQIETIKLDLKFQQRRQPGFVQNSRAHYCSGTQSIEKLITQIVHNSSPDDCRIALSANPFTQRKSADLLPDTIVSRRILSSHKLPVHHGQNLVRRLPAYFDLGLDIIVNHQEMACVCLPENFAIHIESPLIAGSMIKVFDFIWKLGREF